MVELTFESAATLIGRKILWNPKSECAGAGSKGVIKGISSDMCPWGSSEPKTKDVWAYSDQIIFEVGWEDRPAGSTGIYQSEFGYDENSHYIILDESVEMIKGMYK